MKTKKSIAGKILIYFFLILLALLFLVPVFYVMYNSLLPNSILVPLFRLPYGAWTTIKSFSQSIRL